MNDQRIWNHLITHNIVHLANGHYKFHYDSKIGEAVPRRNWSVRLWRYWKKIKQPVLLIRGGQSVLLTQKISEKMKRSYRGEKFDEVVFPACGHVPNLMQLSHMSAISNWLGEASNVRASSGGFSAGNSLRALVA